MIDSYGNEIWEQQELFTCSWGVNSGFKHLQEELDCLVPFQGMCENPRTKNKNLEKYRQASNAAYDIQTPVAIVSRQLSLLEIPVFHFSNKVYTDIHGPPLLSEQYTYLLNCVFRI